MHKLDRDGAFSNGGGASFYGVEANVAGDKDAGNTGLQKIGVAIESP
jgi:hypothetical protein